MHLHPPPFLAQMSALHNVHRRGTVVHTQTHTERRAGEYSVYSHVHQIQRVHKLKGSRCHAGCTNTNPETKMHNAHTHTDIRHTQAIYTRRTHNRHTHTCQHTQNAIIYYYFCVHCLFGTEKVATFLSLSLSLSLSPSTLAQKDVAVVLRTLLCQLSSVQLSSARLDAEQKQRGRQWVKRPVRSVFFGGSQ